MNKQPNPTQIPKEYRSSYPDDAMKNIGTNQIDAEKVRVDPACLWCNNKIFYYYEGSHDWVFNCQECCFEKFFYIPHVGDESQEAINKWFEWVRKVQSCTPANYVLQEPVREQKLDKEITPSPDCESSVINWLPCPFCNGIPSQFGRDFRNGKVVDVYIHPTNDCCLSMLVFDQKRWNTRSPMGINSECKE